jgi:hypothetical protein
MLVMTPAPLSTLTALPSRRVVVTVTAAKMDVEEPGRPAKSVGGIKKTKRQAK